MNHQPTQAASGDESRPSISVQSREEITAHQMSILLSVAQTLRVVAFGVSNDGENPLKESQIAAETALIHTCERIQAMVDEKGRWSLDQHEELHDSILAAHKTQERMMQANLDLIETHKRPSVILKPNIATYGGNYFIAFFGKIEEPGMAIIGRGRTPNEALLDFDKAFNRTPAQQFRIIADLQDAPPAERPAETPEDFHKQNPPQNEP